MDQSAELDSFLSIVFLAGFADVSARYDEIVVLLIDDKPAEVFLMKAVGANSMIRLAVVTAGHASLTKLYLR